MSSEIGSGEVKKIYDLLEHKADNGWKLWSKIFAGVVVPFIIYLSTFIVTVAELRTIQGNHEVLIERNREELGELKRSQLRTEILVELMMEKQNDR